MKKLRNVLCGILAGVLLFIGAAPAALADQSTTIPVTLSVVHKANMVDVTMPVALPVSVLNAKVLTASNVKIMNNSHTDDVEVCGVRVENADCAIGNYDNFEAIAEKTIALSLNGIGTNGAGDLTLNETAFPVIEAGECLSLKYDAKVSVSDEVANMEAARVIFTLRAASLDE